MTDLGERYPDFDCALVVCRRGKEITIKAMTDIEAGHLAVPMVSKSPESSIKKAQAKISTSTRWLLKYNGW